MKLAWRWPRHWRSTCHSFESQDEFKITCRSTNFTLPFCSLDPSLQKAREETLLLAEGNITRAYMLHCVFCCIHQTSRRQAVAMCWCRCPLCRMCILIQWNQPLCFIENESLALRVELDCSIPTCIFYNIKYWCLSSADVYVSCMVDCWFLCRLCSAHCTRIHMGKFAVQIL